MGGGAQSRHGGRGAEYRDEAREYLEVAILRLVLRATARLGRLIELVHRAVPYPVMHLSEGTCEVARLSVSLRLPGSPRKAAVSRRSPRFANPVSHLCHIFCL